MHKNKKRKTFQLAQVNRFYAQKLLVSLLHVALLKLNMFTNIAITVKYLRGLGGTVA